MPVKSRRPQPIPEVRSETRLIRKYGNRRLYDTHASRYVTLEDLVEVFASEDDVRVVDAVNGEDLTKRVLAQAILFEEQRRETQILPLELLRLLLQHRDEAGGAFQRRVARALAEIAQRPRRSTPAPAAKPGAQTVEIDELRKRLKALEKRLQRP